MLPGHVQFTMYVGWTFGPYTLYFNRSRTQLLGNPTVDKDTDIFILEDNGLSVGDQVRFKSTGQLPIPLGDGFYFIRAVNPLTGGFTLSISSGGGLLDIEDNGFGVLTMYKRGVPLNITGWSIWSHVKHATCDPDEDKIIDLGPTITDGINGVAQLYVADEITETMATKVGDHVHSVTMENPGGERVGPFILGPFYIRKASTHL